MHIMQLTTHHCAGCMSTWWQCVSHAERWRSSDDIDRAARVSAYVLHGGRKVAELRLQLVQQCCVHVEQRVRFGVTHLQKTQSLVSGCV